MEQHTKKKMTSADSASCSAGTTTAAVVAVEELRTFASALFRAAGTSKRDAETMGRLLVEQDMAQGDHHPKSHGTRCMTDFGSEDGAAGWQNYIRRMLPRPANITKNYGGRVNPRPVVSVVSQAPTARVYDGDGGLGHIVCCEAVEWAVAAAKQLGTAAATTRNHFHVGATGFYPRIAAREGCICICMSSHRAMETQLDRCPHLDRRL
jgi:LDH2 family malate/lactate/ureidoglycolate dehydrogenase